MSDKVHQTHDCIMQHNQKKKLNCILLTTLLWPGDSNRIFKIFACVWLQAARLSTTNSESFTMTFLMLNFKQKTVNTNLCSLCLDPTRNSTLCSTSYQ